MLRKTNDEGFVELMGRMVCCCCCQCWTSVVVAEIGFVLVWIVVAVA